MGPRIIETVRVKSQRNSSTIAKILAEIMNEKKLTDRIKTALNKLESEDHEQR